MVGVCVLFSNLKFIALNPTFVLQSLLFYKAFIDNCQKIMLPNLG